MTHDRKHSLLSDFIYLARLKGIQVTKESLLSNVSLDNGNFSLSSFLEAAKKFNLSAEVKKRCLSELNPLLLPVVILLQDHTSVVLTQIQQKAQKAQIAIPEESHELKWVDLEKLEQNFTGDVIFLADNNAYKHRESNYEQAKHSPYWLFETLWKFKSYYLRIIVASIFINLFVIATPIFIMNVYDRVVPNQAIETLWVLASGIFIVILFDLILKTLRSYFIDVVGKKADIIMSSKIFEHSLGLSMENQGSSATVRAGQVNTFDKVREFIGSATISTFVDLPFVVLFLLVIRLIGGPLYIPALIASILIIVISCLISLYLFTAVEETFMASAQKNALVNEALEGVETVKSHSAYGLILEKWDKLSALVANGAIKSRFYSSLAVYATQFCVALSTISVVILGVYLIQAGILTTGALIACIILNSRALAPLAQVAQLLIRYQQTKCAYTAVDQIMKIPSEMDALSTSIPLETCNGSITLQNVSFQYKESSSSLFKDISLKIEPGETVAIIGNMGSGKSTFLKLINGLYPITDGTLMIDNIDIRQLNRSDLNRHIGYLDQYPKLFFGTIRENIAFKARWRDDESVIDAAELSGAKQFLGAHPEGYQFTVRENGLGLSKGQIQTIALARAYFSDPSILLLDEPTASMDSQSEQIFRQTMQTYAKDKTVLIVTHKPSIVQLADRILLIHQGKIIMDGPRDQVLAEINARTQKTEEAEAK